MERCNFNFMALTNLVTICATWLTFCMSVFCECFMNNQWTLNTTNMFTCLPEGDTVLLNCAACLLCKYTCNRVVFKSETFSINMITVLTISSVYKWGTCYCVRALCVSDDVEPEDDAFTVKHIVRYSIICPKQKMWPPQYIHRLWAGTGIVTLRTLAVPCLMAHLLPAWHFVLWNAILFSE
jgi:hypothetical protein